MSNGQPGFYNWRKSLKSTLHCYDQQVPMTEISIKALISLAPVIVFLLVLLQLDCHRLVGHHRIGQVFAAGSVLPLLAYFVNGYFIDALQLDFTTYSRQVTPHLQLSKHEFWIIHMFEDELPEMT